MEKYQDDLTKLNSNYMDILIISQGAMTYESMIELFVKRHNERNSES